MQNYLLTLAYDGTNYCGFQVQPNGRSVAAAFQDALEAVAGRAVDRGIGARGLRAILEEVMNKIMYDVPSDPTIAKVTITAPCVTEGAQPEIIRDPERQARLPLGKAALRPERGGMPGTNVG